MFRFRFQALLAIRRREELLQQGALARALVEERAASAARGALADEAERARSLLARAMREPSRGPSGALVALVRHLAEMDARITIASERCTQATRVRSVASARLEEAARPRRALERLEATERERYDAARARADEAELGDANARRLHAVSRG